MIFFFCSYSQELAFITYSPIVYRQPQILLKEHSISYMKSCYFFVWYKLSYVHFIHWYAFQKNWIKCRGNCHLILSYCSFQWHIHWSSLYTSLYTCYMCACYVCTTVLGLQKTQKICETRCLLCLPLLIFHARVGRGVKLPCVSKKDGPEIWFQWNHM